MRGIGTTSIGIGVTWAHGKVLATQDFANCQAKANVVVDGQTILKEVPVTHLLFLEKQLVDLRTFIDGLPTPEAKKSPMPPTFDSMACLNCARTSKGDFVRRRRSTGRGRGDGRSRLPSTRPRRSRGRAFRPPE